jgi:hypothetical protein
MDVSVTTSTTTLELPRQGFETLDPQAIKQGELGK